MNPVAIAVLVTILQPPPPTGRASMQCDHVENPTQVSLASIHATFSRWHHAVLEGDVETLTGLVTEDAEFWSDGQPALRGREALRAAFDPVFERWSLHQEFECRELIVAGGIAFTRGVEVNRLEPRDGGEPVVQRQRAFSVLRKGADGVWRFARGMTNAPPEEPDE